MPAPDFNIGRDVTLDVYDPQQGLLRFKLMTEFRHEPQYKHLESHALDGVPRFAAIPAGHKLVFQFDRASSDADDYFCNQEVNYFAGAVLPQVSITETIQETDGSTTQYRYTNVCLYFTDGGTWKGDSLVNQTIEAMASFKKKVL